MKHWIVAVAAVVPLAACSDDNPAEFGVDTVEQSTTETTGVSETTETTEASVAATASLVAPEVTEVETTAAPTTVTPTTVAPVDEPLAVWEGDTPLTDIAGNPMRMRVELLELSRAGEVVMLRWALTHLGEGSFYFGVTFGEPRQGNLESTQGVHLLDLVNGNKHLTMLDDAGACLCSQISSNLEPEQRMELYGQFAAPPPGVTEVSVVIPNIPPFESVPITEGS